MHSAVEAAEQIRSGALRASELVETVLQRIEAPGPLAGVPFGVKDMDRCAGMPTTFGSLLYKGTPAQREDSVHIGRLRAAGAIPVGMTSCSEFGTLHFVRTRAFGVARNPWAPERTPGGSSGGSAAAVAAGMVPLATAGDGGGSTRIPAAFSGLLGFKPSYGRIPREGASSSQTAVWGALTTTVADAARHLHVTVGPDDRDRTSLPAPGLCYERASQELDVSGLRVGWSPDLGYTAVDPELRELTERAAERLIAAAELCPVAKPPRLSDPFKAWMGNGAIDIWLHLEKGDWPGRSAELVSHVRRSFAQSAQVTAPHYARFLRRRSALEHEVAALFGELDVLLTPTTATAAFAAEGQREVEIDGQRHGLAHTVPFTIIANLCWNPAVSLPAGLTRAGLPVGLQVMVRRHADDIALRLARIFESAQPWRRCAPEEKLAGGGGAS